MPRTVQEKLRLGAVGYLNSKPITYGMEHGLGRNRLSLEFDVPSRTAARLARRELDLGLIPSIEYARNFGYSAVPGICIACDGHAGSVLLFSRVPAEKIRTVAVDDSSRTSAALLRILFRERWGTNPVFTEETPDLATMISRHDAALLIGDRALFGAQHENLSISVTDLGHEWKTLTGMPFVFAFWAGPGRIAGAEEVILLNDSLARGLAHVPRIAETYTWQGKPRPEIALPYLRDRIRYRWGQRERDGLVRFFLLSARHGLIENVPDVTYFGEPVGSEVS